MADDTDDGTDGTIVLLCSVMAEAEHLREQVEDPAQRVIGRKQVVTGVLAGKKIIMAESGVGKVNAAHMTTAILEHMNPGGILLFGCGGAYPDTGLNVGDVAIASGEVYGDEGILTPAGFQNLEDMNLPTLSTQDGVFYNGFSLENELFKQAGDILKEFGISAGTFVTVSCCSGTQKQGERLKERFGGICENMEGAAVAHVCRLYDVPLLEVRGISNLVVDRQLQRWDLPVAIASCQSAVIKILRQL